MHQQHRNDSFPKYIEARETLILKPEILIAIEQRVSTAIKNSVVKNQDEYKHDYDAASMLFPFWENYPPEERGRDPIGDQYPWIEVGEHGLVQRLPAQCMKISLFRILVFQLVRIKDSY